MSRSVNMRKGSDSPFKLSSVAGLSLVEVLISMGLLTAIAVGTSTAILSLGRENKFLTDRLAVQDLTRNVISTLGDPATCSLLFTKPGNVSSPGTLNFTDAPATYPFEIPLNAIPQSPTTDFVSLAQPLVSPLSNTLRILTPGGIQVQVVSASTANLRVRWDSSTLFRPLPDLVVAIRLTTSATGTAHTIVGCGGGATPALRYEGGQNVSGARCPSTLVVNSGVNYCDSSFVKDIVFDQPFSSPPQVIVSPRAESIFTFCPCCLGAYDQLIAYPVNITATGFQVHTSISPMSPGGCGYPHYNWSTETAFDWLAIGY